MKKIIICICTLALLLSLAACGTGEKTPSENAGNDNTSQTDPSKTDDKSEDSAFDYTGNYIDVHLKGDYSITYKMMSSEAGEDDTSYSVKMMRTSEGYYAMLGEDTEMLYIKNGDKYDMYMGDSENGFEPYAGVTLSEDEVKAQTQAFLGYMSAYSQFGDSLKNSGNVTIAGRSCIKYSYDYTALGASAKAEYCIDEETGVCMKYFVEGKSGGESGSYQFECTEFKTSGVALPKHS